MSFYKAPIAAISSIQPKISSNRRRNVEPCVVVGMLSRARRAEYICGVVCMVGADIEPLSIGDPPTMPDFNPSASEDALALANEISPEPGNDRRSLWFSV